MKHERPPFPTSIRITLEDPGASAASAVPTGRVLARLHLPDQSPLSWTIVFLIVVLMVMAVFDQPVRAYALALDPYLRSILKALTAPGNAAWPLGLGLLALLVLRPAIRQASWREAVALKRLQTCILFVMGAVAASGMLASVTKNVIGRARPMTAEGGTLELSFLAFDPGWASFPSGHATTATAMMVALALIWPRHGLGFVTLGILMALTRCLLGAHWLSDVIAGAALGTLVTLALRRKIHGRLNRPLLAPAVERLASRAMQRGLRRGMTEAAEGWRTLRLPAALRMSGGK